MSALLYGSEAGRHYANISVNWMYTDVSVQSLASPVNSSGTNT